jgi:uncharacterized protein (TIGR02996 family)
VSEQLLAAILEDPDDDAPRLVYADWLQTRNDPRGELVQLQCQLAAIDADDDRRRAIKIAENKLLAAHGDAWLAPIREAIPVTDVLQGHKFEFSRGFVEHAQLTLDCAPHFPALWESAPLLRHLRLSPKPIFDFPAKQPTLDGVLDAPELRRLRTLELHLGGAGNAAARVVAQSRTLANLTSLELHLSIWGEGAGIFAPGTSDLELDDDGVAALARSPVLANLEALNLESNRITSTGLGEIAHGAWKLRRLELGNNVLAPETIARSLEGPALANLEVLGLANTTFDAKSIAALVSSPALAKLRELDLEKCHLGVDGIEALCEALALPSLRSLRLERNALCDKGGLAMAGCAAFAQLTNLEAGHNRMGHKAAVALSSSPHLSNLERLTLNEPRWKPETTALFAASPTLAKAKIYLQGRLVGRKPVADKPKVKKEPRPKKQA